MTLAGRVALVTGASRGIGRAVADALGREGAHVVRLARSLEDCSGERVTDLRCDVTREADVRRAVHRLERDRRLPQIVVNNAGAFTLKPFLEISLQEFRRQLAVNLTGPFTVLRALLPHLLAAGGGHVVTIGSVSDHAVLPGNAAYGSSKFGLRALHDVLALEFGGRGIRTTLVSPGATDTGLWDPVEAEARSGLRPQLPSRAAMLRPADVAEAVRFAVTRRPGVNIDVIHLTPRPGGAAPPSTTSRSPRGAAGGRPAESRGAPARRRRSGAPRAH